DGAAEVDVEAGPFALVVGRGEACQRGVDAAFEVAPGLDVVERSGGGRRGGERQRGRAANSGEELFHTHCPFLFFGGAAPVARDRVPNRSPWKRHGIRLVPAAWSSPDIAGETLHLPLTNCIESEIAAPVKCEWRTPRPGKTIALARLARHPWRLRVA